MRLLGKSFDIACRFTADRFRHVQRSERCVDALQARIEADARPQVIIDGDGGERPLVINDERRNTSRQCYETLERHQFSV